MAEYDWDNIEFDMETYQGSDNRWNARITAIVRKLERKKYSAPLIFTSQDWYGISLFARKPKTEEEALKRALRAIYSDIQDAKARDISANRYTSIDQIKELLEK